MTLVEIIKKVKELDAGRGYYTLNEGISVHILRYNRRKHLWEYYFEDERGGVHDYRTFSSEDEACEYVLKDAVHIIDFYDRNICESSS